jgi:hypothetical protein
MFRQFEIGRSIHRASRYIDFIGGNLLPEKIAAAPCAKSAFDPLGRWIPSKCFVREKFESARFAPRHHGEVPAGSATLRAVTGNGRCQFALDAIPDAAAETTAARHWISLLGLLRSLLSPQGSFEGGGSQGRRLPLAGSRY